MIQFDAKDCRDLKSVLSREWLETNGLGGFSSSTIIGLNTRRYHGLLTAATNPPVGRMVLLSKVEETVLINGERYEFSANQYPGAIHPQGFQYLKEFRQDPFPIFTYVVEDIEITKSVFMIYGENSTVIQYQARAATHKNSSQSLTPNSSLNIVLEVRPLVAFRDYHATTHSNPYINMRLQRQDRLISISPYPGLPSLFFSHDADLIDPQNFWFYNFQYERERERGLDFQEDLFSPFALRFMFNPRRLTANIIVSTTSQEIRQAGLIRHSEIHRRREILGRSFSPKEFIRCLTLAADQFIVRRADHKTVIAGYPWFGDWGRDTMISLPGLTLATQQPEVAKNILWSFAQYVDCGMLPNRFPEAGQTPEYNTVDATLWYFEAVRSFLDHTSDYEFIRKNIYPVLCEIVEWHVRGTRYGIHVDQDGLLSAGSSAGNGGESAVQLTWMDAKVGDWVATPRHGKPVEIQALWYNALCVIQELAKEFNDLSSSQRYQNMALRSKESFNQKFWNESLGCLYDVIDGDSHDAAIRPNQIFAVSLFYSMLSPERSRLVVRLVEKELLTPFGLRSLSPKDPFYCGRYEGDPVLRDSVYHQGTVWAWLMGPFISAYLKINHRSPESLQEAKQWLEPLQAHLNEAGLGQISEIFDGDFPHTPRGCIAQAWSVAEILRVLFEDLGEFEEYLQESSREHSWGKL